ncbi:Serine/threonine protein kinase [Fulvivirga imtechensis AK7]|uniref:Serine/threonine protein kinase n=1 Tax=Fulvivirga imtechensis AK7 TaxID=1237149 RepID=L8JU03_9BACT|nr:RDD family protein [Fulvivirga imtechensis]ELR71029.1 Serine/threonine protein kinase [Fulvivirga imtechensis AK7]
METTLDSSAGASSGNYAGFWIRFVAWIIDAIVLSIVNFVIIVPIFGALGFGAYESMSGGEVSQGQMDAMIAMLTGAGLVLQLIQIGIGLLYFALMESSAKQGTVGKMALGLKVIGKDGQRINFGQAVLRYIGKIISGMILMIGYIMAAFTEKKQALHDMIASTYVVK